MQFEDLNYLKNFDSETVDRDSQEYRQWPTASDLESLCIEAPLQLKAIKTRSNGTSVAGIQLIFENGIKSPFLLTDQAKKYQSWETKKVQLTGKNITRIIEKGDCNACRKLSFVHENGTDVVYQKQEDTERVREIPPGHFVVGVYGLFKVSHSNICGLGFITAKI